MFDQSQVSRKIIAGVLAVPPEVGNVYYANLINGEHYQNADFDFSLLNSINNIEQIDLGELQMNDHYLQGHLAIYLNTGDWIILEGENFSPMLRNYYYAGTEVKTQMLADIYESLVEAGHVN